MDPRRVAARVSAALIEEVHITPKPGLVDENNTGSHRDMTIESFENSAAVLVSFFIFCA